MPAPQDILDTINGLQADQDDVAARTAAKSGADVALAAAQSASDAAGHDLVASQQHKAADLQAAIAKLQSAYGPAS